MPRSIPFSVPCSRREFVGSAAAMSVISLARAETSPPPAPRIKKAVKYQMVRENLNAVDKFKLLKDLGYDGVEPGTHVRLGERISVKELAEASERSGLPIHGVVNSSHPDLIGAIDEARIYGADSILHVVRYNTKISYLKNYQETQAIIRQAIPHAEKHRVQILIENVWATFLIEPLGMARYIDELDSPFVQVYFDVGNVVRWGWPEHWIEVLGRRVRKLDIKEYDLPLAMNQGMRKGFSVPLGEGSVNWPRVREELVRINYTGWATAEVAGGDRAHLKDLAARMDRVLGI